MQHSTETYKMCMQLEKERNKVKRLKWVRSDKKTNGRQTDTRIYIYEKEIEKGIVCESEARLVEANFAVQSKHHRCSIYGSLCTLILSALN